MGGVFVSYRNDDRPEMAAAIRGELAKRFGRDRVFRDVDSIGAGERYPAALLFALENADVLVAVIGPGWYAADLVGGRRIDRDGDWVRLEITTAFRLGIPVVPVLLSGAQPPVPGELPPELGPLATVQAQPLHHRRLDDDLKRLVERIEGLVPLLGISRLLAPEPPPLAPLECAPSTLLRPEYGLVEFTGRDLELGQLRTWATGSQPRSVKYVTGTAGSGKTRLAMALCAELAKAGWAAGFLAEDAPAVDLPHAGRLDRPLLLVVDGVGFHLDRLAALATATADSTAPVRILLLGRGEGGWLSALREHPDRLVAELFEPVTPPSRINLEASTADGTDQFARAGRAFARVLDRLEPAGRQFDHTTSLLDIHAAALADVLRPGGGDSEPVRSVVAADRRVFRTVARAHGRAHLATAHLSTVAAVATMCRPASGEQVTVLLGQLPALLGAEGHRADEYAAAFTDLYPGRFWLDAVRPAPVGDHIVAATLASRQNLVTALAAVGDDDQLRNVLAVLGRCVLRHPEAGQAIVDLVRVAPDRIGLLGADAVVRIDEPDALAGWLATALCHHGGSMGGLLTIMERLRHQMPASAADEFVRRFAQEMVRQDANRDGAARGALPTGARASLVETISAQLVRDLLDNRITAEHVRNQTTETPAWMLAFVGRMLRGSALTPAASAGDWLDRLIRRRGRRS